MNGTAVRVHRVSKCYVAGNLNVTALNDVTCTIDAGGLIAIVGPSGSGKSTLLNLIGGLDRPTEGRIYVGDEELTTMNERQLCRYRRTRVGFIFQNFNLLAGQTALENVEFPLVFDGVALAERRERATEALNALGLGDRLQHRPNELSGGQQQRVAIARALVTRPDVLLADEPTGNLDTATGKEILRLLAGLGRQGKTIFIVTHDEGVAGYCRRVLRIVDGKVADDAERIDMSDDARLNENLRVINDPVTAQQVQGEEDHEVAISALNEKAAHAQPKGMPASAFRWLWNLLFGQ